MHEEPHDESPEVRSSPLVEPIELHSEEPLLAPSAEPQLPLPPPPATLNVSDFPKPSVRPAVPSAAPSTVVHSTPLALSSGAAWLPVASLVRVRGRGEVKGSDVRVFDELKVAGGAYSAVLLLTHYDERTPCR